MADTPVVFLRGARQAGKSTLVCAIAAGPYPSHYVTDALVGRMEVLALWPLCANEISGKVGTVIDALFSRTFPKQDSSDTHTDLIQTILSGGFPEPLQRTGRRRRSWFDSYLTTLIDRDIRSIAQIQDLHAVPRLLKLLAGCTATLHNLSEVSRAAGIPNTTLTRYMTLLKTLFLIQELPAWSANLGKRLVKSPKLYVVDIGYK